MKKIVFFLIALIIYINILMYAGTIQSQEIKDNNSNLIDSLLDYCQKLDYSSIGSECFALYLAESPNPSEVDCSIFDKNPEMFNEVYIKQDKYLKSQCILQKELLKIEDKIKLCQNVDSFLKNNTKGFFNHLYNPYKDEYSCFLLTAINERDIDYCSNINAIKESNWCVSEYIKLLNINNPTKCDEIKNESIKYDCYSILLDCPIEGQYSNLCQNPIFEFKECYSGHGASGCQRQVWEKHKNSSICQYLIIPRYDGQTRSLRYFNFQIKHNTICELSASPFYPDSEKFFIAYLILSTIILAILGIFLFIFNKKKIINIGILSTLAYLIFSLIPKYHILSESPFVKINNFYSSISGIIGLIFFPFSIFLGLGRESIESSLNYIAPMIITPLIVIPLAFVLQYLKDKKSPILKIVIIIASILYVIFGFFAFIMALARAAF